MKNEKIRNQIKESGYFKWEIAEKIGVCEMTLIRWLRTELSQEQEAKILNAISALKEGE